MTMPNPVILIYDETFEGFLCCVFAIYDLKLTNFKIQRESVLQSEMFSENLIITTDTKKSDRVWNSIKNKTSKDIPNKIYYAYLSEQPNIETVLMRYIKYILDNDRNVGKDFSHPDVLKVAQVAKMVGREKHRMEAFIRFRLTKDEIYFAVIEPDFNVIPLIIKHFKSRYADQKWLIYDLKRKYGIYYDLQKVDSIVMEFIDGIDPSKTTVNEFDEEELDFQNLWIDYFKSTNIESRKNMKLHIRHVPKRYWKYLSEKRPY